MAFTSVLHPNEPLIDDGNYLQHVRDYEDLQTKGGGQVFNKGRIPRDYGRVPRGALAPYATVSGIPNIPEEQWTDIIQQMEKDKSRLSDIRLLKKVPSLDQNGTNYCWCNAVVSAATILRLRMNLPYVKLSAASVAAQIKGYRNEGGWGAEALSFIVKNGIAPDALWPTNYWSSNKYLTAEMKQAALLHKIDQWFELDARNFNQLMSCVLSRIPVPIGLNWWSHEICALDGVVLGPREFGIRIWNSWGDVYGSMGTAVLTRSKATPDDAVAPYGILAAAA